MNEAIAALIRTTVADMEPRIQIAQTNVDTLYAQLSEAETHLAALIAERDQLIAGLPVKDDAKA